MPYVNEDRRRAIKVGQPPQTIGELNYAITWAAHSYVLRQYPEVNYASLNKVYGAMQAAAAEFYRCVLAPYEDRKREQTGPISALDTPRPIPVVEADGRLLPMSPSAPYGVDRDVR